MSGRELTIDAVELYERDVRLRLPFRFGVATLTAAPQAFVRARVRLADGREGWGAAAELLAPKWFDKNLALSNEENFQQLRDAIRLTADAYTSDRTARPAFAHYAAHYTGQLVAAAAQGLNPLVASYGPALVDRAVLDAQCRLLGVSFFEAIRRNLPGMTIGALTPDLAGFDLDAFLASLSPARTLASRHTVGLVDPLTAADLTRPLDDGLPETLESIVATYGHRHFKLKVGGDIEADVTRLTRIAAIIDRIAEPYIVTLDGNEQYRDIDAVAALWARMNASPALARLVAATIFIEQPIVRTAAMERPVGSLAALKPLLVDESDGTLDAFVRARELGYTGVSSKACKGFYKSLLNAARCRHWRNQSDTRYFMSAEDLTCQAGLAVQQDLALVALLGVDHVERNGHHYVAGFGDTPAAEQARFLAAHPDLYVRHPNGVRLRIEAGRIAIGSLDTPGFGSGALPDLASMRRVFQTKER